MYSERFFFRTILLSWWRNTVPHSSQGCAMLVIVVVSLGMFASSAQAAGWSTTRWQVECYVPTCEQWYGDEARCESGQTQDYESYYDELATEVEYEWYGEASCKDEPGSEVAEAE